MHSNLPRFFATASDFCTIYAHGADLYAIRANICTLSKRIFVYWTILSQYSHILEIQSPSVPRICSRTSLHMSCVCALPPWAFLPFTPANNQPINPSLRSNSPQFHLQVRATSRLPLSTKPPIYCLWERLDVFHLRKAWYIPTAAGSPHALHVRAASRR